MTAWVEGQHFAIRLKHSPGYVVGEIRSMNESRWKRLTGRFGDESSLRHSLEHTIEFSLAADTSITLDDAVMKALTLMNDQIVGGQPCSLTGRR